MGDTPFFDGRGQKSDRLSGHMAGQEAGPFTFPADPDWPALEARFGGVLLRTGVLVDDIAQDARGGLLMLSADPQACQLAIGDAVLALAWSGVTVVSPDLVAAAVTPDWPEDIAGNWQDGATWAAMWARWRQPLLRAASGVVVLGSGHWDRSVVVWSDVRAALSANQRVWILGGDGWRCGGDPFEGVDF